MANTIGMEAIVEIDENERYWVGKGFGKGGLLPNDRGAYTTTDGSIFWKSVDEASEDLQLLGRGWVYYKGKENGFALTKPEQPEKCWLYATDFRNDNMHTAKPNRGALHWVRFRRLVRVKVFNPEEFVSREIYEKCDHCDLAAVETVSELLLDVLAYTSLLHDKSNVTDAILLKLKQAIIDLAISHEISDRVEMDSTSQLQLLQRKLENFVETERSNTKLNRLLSGVHFSFPGRNKWKEFRERCEVVAARCLSKAERDAIAGLLVRKFDPNFHLHCDRIACGEDCRFAPVDCPNDGCYETMSKIHLAAHKQNCAYKMVECECGESFKSRELHIHQKEACQFRAVDCPFKDIGCIKEVKACDLQQHVTDDATSHLLLAVGQIKEQQQEIRNLQTRLGNLQSQKEELSRNLQDQKDQSAKEVTQLQTKTTKLAKDLANFEKSSKKEFRKLNSPRQTLS